MSGYLEVPGFENITHENMEVSDAVGYLNSVLIIYGPPCEWCKHFSAFCSKKFRPRQRSLKFGPFSSWYLRKHCKGFEDKKDSEEDHDAAIERRISNQLNCGAQTYGS